MALNAAIDTGFRRSARHQSDTIAADLILDLNGHARSF
jgi:hypothetical protein